MQGLEVSSGHFGVEGSGTAFALLLTAFCCFFGRCPKVVFQGFGYIITFRIVLIEQLKSYPGFVEGISFPPRYLQAEIMFEFRR